MTKNRHFQKMITIAPILKRAKNRDFARFLAKIGLKNWGDGDHFLVKIGQGRFWPKIGRKPDLRGRRFVRFLIETKSPSSWLLRKTRVPRCARAKWSFLVGKIWSKVDVALVPGQD